MPVPLSVPCLGNSAIRALIAEWYLPDGAPVATGDAVFRLECDAVAVEVEAASDGLLRYRLDPGALCSAGDVAGLILAAGEPAPPLSGGTCPTLPPAGPSPEAPLTPLPFAPRTASASPGVVARPPVTVPQSITGDAGEAAPAPSAALAAAPLLRLTVRLAGANHLRVQLSREWRPAGLAPLIEDVVARAVAMAIAECQLLAHFGDSVALSIAGAGDEPDTVSAVTARMPFREAVSVRMAASAGSRPDGPVVATITSFAPLGIDDAALWPGAGELLALSIGAPRTGAAFQDGCPLPEAVATLSLAFDPRWLTAGVAAGLLARIRDLVEAPYALLAG